MPRVIEQYGWIIIVYTLYNCKTQHDKKLDNRRLQVATIKRDTSKSDEIVRRFRESAFKSKRKRTVFSGTWESTVEELFPLFCPAREADWIPSWDCNLIYTDSGLAEDNCIFETDQSTSFGDGLWVFIGYEVNRYIEFVRVQKDLVFRGRITVNDNQDGTVTATWDILRTGLTERGNREIDALPEENPPEAAAAARMIEHYLKKGKTINRAALAMGMVAQHVSHHW
jgi:hypothetical protein